MKRTVQRHGAHWYLTIPGRVLIAVYRFDSLREANLHAFSPGKPPMRPYYVGSDRNWAVVIRPMKLSDVLPLFDRPLMPA